MQHDLPLEEHDEGHLPSSLGPNTVRRSKGTNASEQYLAELSERTFLSLWSYPNIYRNQDRKEVCDLLVVCEKDILIFSDKHVEYKPHVNPTVAWRRWYKKAVEQSANQLYGAEQWIKQLPESLCLDPLCTQRFPLPIPESERMRVHRIVVAHGASEACQRALGGSGSLMIVASLIGDDHLLPDDDHISLMSNGLLETPITL